LPFRCNAMMEDEDEKGFCIAFVPVSRLVAGGGVKLLPLDFSSKDLGTGLLRTLLWFSEL